MARGLSIKAGAVCGAARVGRRAALVLMTVGGLLPGSPSALALDHQGRLRADYHHLTEGAQGSPGSQLVGYGLRLHLEGAGSGPHLEGAIIARAREDLLRDQGTRRSVSALWVRLADLGPADVTIGRMMLGEGTAFLLVDGGGLTWRFTDDLVLDLVGGLTGALDDFTPDRDRPAAGAAFNARVGDWLDASTSASLSVVREAPTGREDQGEAQRQVMAAAGRALITPGPSTWLFLSGEIAERSGWAADPAQALNDPWRPLDETVTLTQLYAQAGYRPGRPLRLDASMLRHWHRFGSAGDEDRFTDAAARVRYRLGRSVHLMGRGRLRWRTRQDVRFDADEPDDLSLARLGTVEERAARYELGLDLRRLGGTGLGGAARYITDVGARHDKQALSVEAGYERARWWAWAGWRTTARDPDDGFSTWRGGDEPDAVYAYSRMVQHAAHVRAGWILNQWLVSLSMDHDLIAEQTAGFVQVSCAWR